MFLGPAISQPRSGADNPRQLPAEDEAEHPAGPVVLQPEHQEHALTHIPAPSREPAVVFSDFWEIILLYFHSVRL